MRTKLAVCVGALLAVSGFSAETPYGINEVVKLIQEKKIRSVDQFIEHLPREIKKDWFALPASISAQGGMKFILRAPKSRFTITFNISPEEDGFDSIEMKQFQELPKPDFELAEVRFEDDFQPDRWNGKKRIKPKYENGSHIARQALHTPFLDNPETCGGCHTGGDSRFDFREVREQFAKKQEDPERWQSLLAKIATPKEPRVRHLPKTNPGEWLRSAKRMHRELSELNSQVIAQKVADLVAAKDSSVATAMLGILKGCDFANLFTRDAWNQRVRYFQVPNEPFRPRDSTSLQTAAWLEKDEAPNLDILTKIKSKLDEERGRYNVQYGDEDKKTDTAKLSRFIFLFDELVERTKTRDFKEGDDIRVLNWAMSSNNHGYWFSETFPLYENELTKRFEKQVEQYALLPPAKQTCQNLEEASRHAFITKSLEGPGAHAPRSPGILPMDGTTHPPTSGN